MPRAQMLFFTGPDCPACEQIKPLAQGVCNKHRIKMLEIDCTEETELASKYDINILPTMVYKDHTIEGFCTEEDIQNMFN